MDRAARKAERIADVLANGIVILNWTIDSISAYECEYE